MKYVTTHYYLSQHKDNGPDEYDVVKHVSEWENAWPKDLERTTILAKLDRDAASTAVRVFNAEVGYRADGTTESIVADITRQIDFLLDNETNRNTAETVCPYPVVF